MAEKTKNLDITIVAKKGAFNVLFKRFKGNKDDYDFEGLSALRKLISNEKARILHIIKTKNPGSIYKLAKILKRDFKSVSEDIKLLERFGFIDMISEKTGKRERLKPIISVNNINIQIKI